MQIWLDSRWRLLSALALTVASFAASAHAQTPQYRHVVFITNNTYSISAGAEPHPGASNFGGALSADLQVNRRANAAQLLPGWNGSDRIYKALISTNDVNARDRMEIVGPVYNRNGDLLATDSADFWDGYLLSPVNYNEFGTALQANSPFWTGSDFNGYQSSQCCQNWTQTTSQIGAVGYSSAADLWFNQAQLSCSQARRLMGISPPILLGDFDRDNDVDGRDFLIWQRSDPNSSVITSAGGLAGWQTNYGVVVEPLAASTAVPEPSSILLVGLASLGLLRRR